MNIIRFVQNAEKFFLLSEKLSNSIDSLCFDNFFYAILQNDEKLVQKA